MTLKVYSWGIKIELVGNGDGGLKLRQNRFCLILTEGILANVDQAFGDEFRPEEEPRL